jgi:hypothetical protein
VTAQPDRFEDHDWRGVTGAFSFDADGDAAKPVLCSVGRGGRFEYLPSPAPAAPAGTGAHAAGLRP